MRKKGIKRLISCMLILALILTASLAGCAKKGQKIAFFKYKSGDTFISEMMGYMTARVPQGVTFEVRDAGNSQSVQNQQIVDLVSGGFDLLVINAVDRLACSSIIAKCAAEGTPIIFFNREPPGDALDGSDAFYVGADTDSMGKKQAEMVAELFGGGFTDSKFDKNGDGVVQTAILKGEQGHQDAEKRTDNCIAHLKSLGYSVDVLAIEVADWNRRDGYDAMKSLYEAYGDSIELIFSNNDDMALGAIDYLLDEDIFSQHNAVYEQPIVVVGVDGTEVGLEAIEKGLLYGTVNNDYRKQSDAILTLVDYILSGDSFEDFPYSIIRSHYIYISGDIITQANLKEFLSSS